MKDISIEYRPLSSSDLGTFLRIYEESFPENERRIYRNTYDLEDFILSKDGQFSILGAYEGDTLIGFISYWDFDSRHYIEHFAMDPAKRGANIGGRMLDTFIERVSPDILIEVERPVDDITRRRIGFYERHGFRLHPDVDYVQPPYSPGQEGLPMLLMTHGNALPDPSPLFSYVYPRPISE